MRLDKFLIEKGFYETRNKAQNAIYGNLIKVNNIIVNKPNYLVNENDLIEKVITIEYVSRGAYKLLAAIDKWKIDFHNRVVLDVGASTGGFTDVAIKNGAKFVYAVDVGSSQLHHSLLTSDKIKSIENTHLKDLFIDLFKTKIDIVVADLSFISLTKLIDKLISLFNYNYQCVFLIKPEFELSPKEINKGKVKSLQLQNKAVNKIKTYAIEHGFKVFGVIPSPIKGNKMGNVEYLIYMEKK
jgi:23S rRNA (cytidine1920-2'-O)/16S rRNA (cytidine1409-2'-O)-methyltransferase